MILDIIFEKPNDIKFSFVCSVMKEVFSTSTDQSSWAYSLCGAAFGNKQL
jgi:hypothetical protein